MAKDHTQTRLGSSSSIFLLQHIWRTAAVETREAKLIIGRALSLINTLTMKQTSTLAMLLFITILNKAYDSENSLNRF